MSAAAQQASESAPLPERGMRVLLDGLPGGPWSSLVEGLAGRTLTLEPPRLGGHVVALPLGRPFVIAYASREVPCEIDAELVGGPDHEGRGHYAARLVGEGRRLQRRRAVRVSVHLLVRTSLGGEQETLSSGAITENLSAAGALLRLARPIEANASITTTVLCGGDAGAVEIHGRVVRCDRIDSQERPFRVAVAFEDLVRADEDRLTRFIFEQQREARRREVGLS